MKNSYWNMYEIYLSNCWPRITFILILFEVWCMNLSQVYSDLPPLSKKCCDFKNVVILAQEFVIIIKCPSFSHISIFCANINIFSAFIGIHWGVIVCGCPLQGCSRGGIPLFLILFFLPKVSKKKILTVTKVLV